MLSAVMSFAVLATQDAEAEAEGSLYVQREHQSGKIRGILTMKGGGGGVTALNARKWGT